MMGAPAQLLHLADPAWGEALEYSHIIFGFTTVTYMDPNLPDLFLGYAVDNAWTLVNSYQVATIATFSSDVKAAVMADTDDQFYLDRLWGRGYVAPDEYPDDDYVKFYEWTC